MPNAPLPELFAFDFDGVICDGLVEYFQTAWRAYCRIWSPDDKTPPQGLAERFYPLRPVIETGWEMPVLLRSLLQGIPDAQILTDWPTARDRIIADGLNPKDLAAAVDGVRDEWIRGDLDGWLSQHRFYPGMVALLEHLRQQKTRVVIITTKEGRFAARLLAQAGVAMPEGQIYGKEVKRPKYETLRDLISESQAESVWFLEDRLQALLSVVQQPDLGRVRLLLADWGYNTEADRQRGQEMTGIEVVGLEGFVTALK